MTMRMLRLEAEPLNYVEPAHLTPFPQHRHMRHVASAGQFFSG